MKPLTTYPLLAVVAIALSLSIVSCKKDGDPSDDDPPVAGYISGVSGNGAQGALQSGSAPQSAGGPAAVVSGTPTVINGGSTITRVTATQSFQTVYVTVGGVAGHWSVRLPSAVTEALLLVSLGRTIPASSFDLSYGVASASGTVGTFSTIRTTVDAGAATGTVQVSASWDALSDVDLHVVEPSGAEIYYGNPVSATGGRLDLDSNAGCDIDRVNNENIRWATSAPTGTYTVRLDYWSSCNVAITNYVVTVNNGGNSQVFSGNFTGGGTQGAAGSGRLITTFNRTSSSVTTSAAPMIPMPTFTPSALKRRLSLGQ